MHTFMRALSLCPHESLPDKHTCVRVERLSGLKWKRQDGMLGFTCQDMAAPILIYNIDGTV